MPRLDDARAFLAQHSEAGGMPGRAPGTPDIAMSAAEAEFRQRLLAAGYSGSYLALLGLGASMTYYAGLSRDADVGTGTGTGTDADAVADADQSHPTDADRRGQCDWHCHLRGLQTALCCLVMHETGANPRQAALLVVQHIETLTRCRWTGQPTGSGG